MNIKEATKILKEHNLWRRDKNEINSRDMISPTILGYAIDTVVAYLENEDDN